MSLEGKVAIVTGSSRGIGKAIALGLASEGATLVIAARSTESRPQSPGSIYDTAREIELLGGKALPVECNVREAASIQEMVRKSVESLGSVDVLINNAGVGNYSGFLETSLKAWDLVMDIDLRAPFICCQEVVPIMIKQQSGSIINISSHAATNIFSSTLSEDSSAGIALMGQAYGTAKAGLERFTWGLAAELGEHNIAVNILKPLRPVVTEGFQAQRPDADVSTWVTPQDMVKASIHLAKQDAHGLTGAAVTAEEIVRRLSL
ncbi:MAG: SDR family NAD(P)-dependent oxidoreductase [Chloroflexota bacterium]|nr:SDR family NAD(P)-dependent oxidoreductase [Chloroflexota bacterium]